MADEPITEYGVRLKKGDRTITAYLYEPPGDRIETDAQFCATLPTFSKSVPEDESEQVWNMLLTYTTYTSHPVSKIANFCMIEEAYREIAERLGYEFEIIKEPPTRVPKDKQYPPGAIP